MGFSLLGPLVEGSVRLPLCTFKIPAGFPSPATDHMEQPISLDEVLSLRAPHVYLVTIDGDSMQGVGIFRVTWRWLIALLRRQTGIWWWLCLITSRSVSG